MSLCLQFLGLGVPSDRPSTNHCIVADTLFKMNTLSDTLLPVIMFAGVVVKNIRSDGPVNVKFSEKFFEPNRFCTRNPTVKFPVSVYLLPNVVVETNGLCE